MALMIFWLVSISEPTADYVDSNGGNSAEHTPLACCIRGSPNNLRPHQIAADSPIVVATTVQGKIFLPRYHGRAFVEILGEESEGQIIPPRYRPKPNSPVFPLNRGATARVVK